MRRTRTLLIVTAAALALAAWAAEMAGAALIGSKHKFRYVQNTTSVSGGGTAFAGSTDCGAGFVVLSGGTVMTGQPAELFAAGSFTTGTHRLWRSSGFNTGFGKNVSTVAMCRKANPNFRYVKQTETLPASPSVAGAQASCPGGKMIAGGGVSIQGPLSQVHVSASRPDTTRMAWKATVVNDSGAARPFSVYAVCMPSNSGLTYYGFGSTIPPSPGGFSVDITCGSTASVPLSAGIGWSGNPSQVHIASSGPINSSGGVNTVPDKAWRIGTVNTAGATKNLSGDLICAPA